MRNRAAVTVAVALAACSVGRDPGADPVPRLSGCYTFDQPHFRWTGAASMNDGTIRLFETPSPAATAARPGLMAVHATSHKTDRTREQYESRSHWEWIGPDTIRIVWSSGLSGRILRVKVEGDSLTGEVATFSDHVQRVDTLEDGTVRLHFPEPTWRPTRAWRVACPSGGEAGGETGFKLSPVGGIKPRADSPVFATLAEAIAFEITTGGGRPEASRSSADTLFVDVSGLDPALQQAIIARAGTSPRVVFNADVPRHMRLILRRMEFRADTAELAIANYTEGRPCERYSVFRSRWRFRQLSPGQWRFIGGGLYSIADARAQCGG